MKIAHRTRLLDHVPKLLNVHRAIRVDVRRRPIALGQTRRLRHGDPLPLHRLERNAAVQHLLVEYPPRPLPDSPGIDRQRVEHHRHARQPTVRGLVLRSILLDQRKEPLEYASERASEPASERAFGSFRPGVQNEMDGWRSRQRWSGEVGHLFLHRHRCCRSVTARSPSSTHIELRIMECVGLRVSRFASGRVWQFRRGTGARTGADHDGASAVHSAIVQTDARCWTLDAGRWTLDARRSALDPRPSTLGAGSSTLDARPSTLDARHVPCCCLGRP